VIAAPRFWPACSGAVAVVGLFAFAQCGKGTGATASAASSSSASADAAPDGDGGPPMDSREADAWSRATRGLDGGDDDLIRLAELVGCPGLHERAGDEGLRRTAVRAAAYCNDFSELPWLARLGADARDEEAVDALDAIVDQAARVRRATDPEDADELHAGCGTLLELARSTAAAPRRVRAIRALRMLADRGCVKVADIPHDLDAK
jgi:hypothetical protein